MGTCGWVFGWSLCLSAEAAAGGALLGEGVGANGSCTVVRFRDRRPGWAWQVVGIAGQWVWGGRLGVESRSYLASLHPCFHGQQRMTPLQLLEGLAHVRFGDSAWSAAMLIQGCKWLKVTPCSSIYCAFNPVIAAPVFLGVPVSQALLHLRWMFPLYRCPGGSASSAPPGRVLEPTLEPVPDSNVV